MRIGSIVSMLTVSGFPLQAKHGIHPSTHIILDDEHAREQ